MAGDSRRQERSDLGEFAHGQFRVDYEHRPDPEALRRLRIERARAAMEEAGLDGLLLWTTENVRYLAGLRPQLITGRASSSTDACFCPRPSRLRCCPVAKQSAPALSCRGSKSCTWCRSWRRLG